MGSSHGAVAESFLIERMEGAWDALWLGSFCCKTNDARLADNSSMTCLWGMGCRRV